MDLSMVGDAGLFLYLEAAAAILAVAMRRQAITADGAVAARLTALTLYALGGVWVGASLNAFFILGSLASGLKNSRKRMAEKLQADTHRHQRRRQPSQPLCGRLYCLVCVSDPVCRIAAALFQLTRGREWGIIPMES